MNHQIRRSFRLFAVMILCCMLPLAAGAWEPDPDDKRQVKAHAELQKYLARPKIKAKLDEAYGYAILPTFFRGAVGLGVNYGNGLVIEQEHLVGKVWTIQGTIGFTYGVQGDSQILIFRDQETMEIFQTGRFEFQGRGSGVAIAWGGAVNPGFLPGVAIYSRIKGGLMVEIAAILAKYNYKDLQGQ